MKGGTPSTEDTTPHAQFLAAALYRFDKPEQRETIMQAHAAYATAASEWNLKPSNKTLTNLIGTWSRVTRIILEMEANHEGR